jgi:hypothetical protein
MAAHYGSVSVVTFAVASAYLAAQGVETEAHAALWVAIMEAPGIVAGILLARWAPPAPGGAKARINWGELGHDVFFGKSVLLLAGGLIIGAVMGEAGTAPIAPVFMAPFKGVLALFLLELGLVAGGRLGDLAPYGVRIIGFALIAPPLLAVFGALTGRHAGPEHRWRGHHGHAGGQRQLHRCAHGHAHGRARSQRGPVHHRSPGPHLSVQHRAGRAAVPGAGALAAKPVRLRRDPPWKNTPNPAGHHHRGGP